MKFSLAITATAALATSTNVVSANDAASATSIPPIVQHEQEIIAALNSLNISSIIATTADTSAADTPTNGDLVIDFNDMDEVVLDYGAEEGLTPLTAGIEKEELPRAGHDVDDKEEAGSLVSSLYDNTSALYDNEENELDYETHVEESHEEDHEEDHEGVAPGMTLTKHQIHHAEKLAKAHKAHKAHKGSGSGSAKALKDKHHPKKHGGGHSKSKLTPPSKSKTHDLPKSDHEQQAKGHHGKSGKGSKRGKSNAKRVDNGHPNQHPHLSLPTHTNGHAKTHKREQVSMDTKAYKRAAEAEAAAAADATAETESNISLSPPADEAAMSMQHVDKPTPPSIVEYTEPPNAEEAVSTSATTETQPVSRTPDAIPKGSDSSLLTLQDAKFHQEISEAMMGDKAAANAAASATHHSKGSVGTLSVKDKERGDHYVDGGDGSVVVGSASVVNGATMVGGVCAVMALSSVVALLVV